MHVVILQNTKYLHNFNNIKRNAKYLQITLNLLFKNNISHTTFKAR